MPYDFEISTNGAPVISAGDFAVIESTYQHQWMLLQLKKGDIKQHPLACVGVAAYLKEDEVLPMLAEIKRECESDGMSVALVEIDSEGNLQLEASYGY